MKKDLIEWSSPLTSCIGMFAAPRKVFSDNGGEVIGEDFVKFCEIFNIRATTAASYSPWALQSVYN